MDRFIVSIISSEDWWSYITVHTETWLFDIHIKKLIHWLRSDCAWEIDKKNNFVLPSLKEREKDKESERLH